jgi:hypothetical protein
VVIQLQDGAINARGDDVSKLMSRVASWLNQQYPKEDPLSDDSRIGRGIHHPITGMLLCPIRYDWSDERYGFLLLLNSVTHFDTVTVFATNCVPLLQTTTTRLTSAFGPSTVDSRARWMSLNKAFSRVVCSSRFVFVFAVVSS